MTNARKTSDTPARGSLSVSDLSPQPLKKVEVRHLPEAPKGLKGRKIHPRRPAPLLPAGQDVPDSDPSPPVNLGSRPGRTKDK